ncbi:MAG: SusC/RagA family TonB-linked outer membrane protein [Bacteroidales bacterium]
MRQKHSFRVLLVTFFLGALSLSVNAQNKIENNAPISISGVIIDTKGEAIIGGNILVKGTTIGTLTDIEGKFKLKVPVNAKLVVSYVGFLAQEVIITDKTFYKISLKEESKNLDEVVVVGYGVVNKRSYTGSISSIKSEEITALKTMSPTQGLQGRAAGVNVTTASGMPGAPTTIRVRGVNSISSGNDPLWIIDGVPMYSGGGLEKSSSTVSQDPMSMINPSDIETMEVLKDAAATAIYGSRGSNGVIMITTKSGKKNGGKGTINVDYTMGFSDLTRTPEQIGYASTKQWIEMADKAIQNSTGDPTALFTPSMTVEKAQVAFEALTREQALATNSNWFKEVLRTGEYKDFNLNMTKGFEGGSVYTSFNYRNDAGVLKNNDLNRLTGRINSEFTIIKNLQVGSNMAFSYSRNNRVKTGYAGAIGAGGGMTGGFEAANRNAMPWMPIYSSENTTGYWSARSGNLAANNDRRFLQDYVIQNRVVGNTFAEFKVVAIKGLSLRSEFGLDNISNSSVDWRSDLITVDGKSYSLDQNVNRSVINYNAYLKYNNKIGKNAFNSVLGTESTRMTTWTRLLEANGLVGQYPELGSTPANMLSMSSKFSAEDYLRSYFFRTDYRLLDKYVLAVSLRTDGSSKFSAEKRWGTFAAISGGWLVSEEPFFASFRDVMNQFKLKTSFGQTGNNAIPNNSSTTVYSNNSLNRYGLDSDIAAGTIVSNIGNGSITWETTNNYDFGIDYGFLNSRISGSIEGYYKKVVDMLLSAELPNSTGIGGNKIWANIGDMSNYGIDFSISSKNIDKKNFTWTTDFNVSFNENKILSLTPALNVGGKGVGYRIGTQNVTGNRLGTFFMADYAGIDPDKGVEMIWEIDQTEYNASGKTIKTGRKIPATQENVQVNRYLFQDKTIIPTFFGGINNTFKYKNLDLNLFLTFSGGNYIYDYNRKRASYVHNGQTVLLADVNENTVWAAGKTDATYPLQSWESSYTGAAWNSKADDPNLPAGNAKGWWDSNATAKGNYNLESYNHSKYMYRGDFIRLKNLSLGYTLPKTFASKLALQQLRLSVQGSNLLTITAYPGYDPEGATWVDAASIPNTRTISFGLSAKF